MSWNYRVVNYTNGKCGIHNAYYNVNDLTCIGNASLATTPAYVSIDLPTLESLEELYSKCLSAFKKAQFIEDLEFVPEDLSKELRVVEWLVDDEGELVSDSYDVHTGTIDNGEIVLNWSGLPLVLDEPTVECLSKFFDRLKSAFSKPVVQYNCVIDDRTFDGGRFKNNSAYVSDDD